MVFQFSWYILSVEFSKYKEVKRYKAGAVVMSLRKSLFLAVL